MSPEFIFIIAITLFIIVGAYLGYCYAAAREIEQDLVQELKGHRDETD